MRVALTFDDGPVPRTADLLDELDRRRVRATFFLLGANVAAGAALVARMAASGHEVGNHGYDHSDLTGQAPSAVQWQLRTTNDLIERAGGVAPRLFRPPYGATDPGLGAVAAGLGLTQVLWNVDPQDWLDPEPGLIVERVLAEVADGAIVLAHDPRPATRAACPLLLDALLDLGCRLVTVSELLAGPDGPVGTGSQRETRRGPPLTGGRSR